MTRPTSGEGGPIKKKAANWEQVNEEVVSKKKSTTPKSPGKEKKGHRPYCKSERKIKKKLSHAKVSRIKDLEL